MTLVNANPEQRRITKVAVNKIVHSCWTEHRDLHVIFIDGFEMIVTWGDRHAELRGTKVLNSLPANQMLYGPVSAILGGKTISYCYLNDDDDLVIRTQCGHEAVIGYEGDAPVIRRMDVKIELPAPPAMGAILGWPT